MNGSNYIQFKVKLIIFILLGSILFGCQKKDLTANEIYETYKNAVVLIKTDYYFKLQLKNDISLNFIPNDDGISFFSDEEITDNILTAFGTGFFIDKSGQIATNLHVAKPFFNEGSNMQELNQAIRKTRSSFLEKLEEYDENLNELELLLRYEIYNEEEENEINRTRQAISRTRLARTRIKEYLEAFEGNINLDNVKTEIVKIGVAYDDTFITNVNDFQGCVLIEESKNQEIDLAIIQLKLKRTPEFVTNTLKIESLQKENAQLQLDDKVFMIGYNYGLSIANTSTGIKAQLTSGNISQLGDKIRFMYTIPTLSGSSGSPIINAKGNLVGINYAKITESQGFNYGIHVSHLKSLLQNEIIEISSNSNSNPPPSKINGINENTSINYPNILREFIKAEDTRNLNVVLDHYSNNVARYYHLNFPSKLQLVESYQLAWNNTTFSRNEILSINEITSNTFEVKVNFIFVLKANGNRSERESVIKFVFDNEGKIIEIFSL